MKKRLAVFFLITVNLLFFACGGNHKSCGGNTGTEKQDTENAGTDDAAGQQDNTEAQESDEESIMKLKIKINGKCFTASFYDNSTTEAFKKILPITINMSAMAHEKYYYLSKNLPTSATSSGAIYEGDIMLWGSNCLVLFYESFSTSYSYTKIGKIEETEGLAAAVGAGNVTITFSI